MKQVEWPAEFEALVSSHLPDPPRLGHLDPELDLPTAGIDSLETIGLITDLEERFAFEFPDALLSMATFSTPRALWAAVAECLSSRAV